ncbi:ferrochelatase [Limibacter armeniacum]|uniref:ferrochelatase n=1 Tax=Limibacter armeniacum TaxID=466084 RepID=UPI002FE5602D
MKKVGILLVNLGTPNTPERSSVRKYLTEFLMDNRVIDIPYWKRSLLVKGVIAPFRSKHVAKEYKKLWGEDGGPLLVHGRSLEKKLNEMYRSAGIQVTVQLAMRYQNPSIQAGLEALREEQVEKIVVFPLFPQYASATTGSVAQKVMEVVSTWQVIPSMEFINSYHTHPLYIDAFVEKVKKDIEKYKPEHVLFSYHGVPERHITKLNKEVRRKNNPYDYKVACKETSDLIADKLGLSRPSYTTSFQSRLGKDPWIKPYTDATIESLAQAGTKNLLVVSPSFVADCLETTLEIGEEYRELFESLGGQKFHFTESLNDDEQWVEAIFNIINIKNSNRLSVSKIHAA